jgi:hypothetical protein
MKKKFGCNIIMYITKIENNRCVLYDEQSHKIKEIGKTNAISGMALDKKVIIVYNNGECELYDTFGHKLREIGKNDGFIKNAVIAGDNAINVSFKNGKNYIYNFRGQKLREV